MNERLAYARRELHLTQAQFSEKICVSKGFLSLMEIGDRKINSRILKIINLTTGISSKWLKTGEGDMFSQNKDLEIEEIITLYRQLNPFFKGFFKRQLLEIVNYEDGTTASQNK